MILVSQKNFNSILNKTAAAIFNYLFDFSFGNEEVSRESLSYHRGELCCHNQPGFHRSKRAICHGIAFLSGTGEVCACIYHKHNKLRSLSDRRIYHFWQGRKIRGVLALLSHNL